MEIETILTAISTVGFPIFVACWTLYKSDERQKETNNILTDLKLAIQKLTDQTKKEDGEDD